MYSPDLNLVSTIDKLSMFLPHIVLKHFPVYERDRYISIHIIYITEQVCVAIMPQTGIR
jgi:hypothetical protein